MNPIIKAIPGIPSIVLVAMEYYHTSSDDDEDEVVVVVDDPGEVIDHVIDEPPAADQEVVDDRDEEEIENGHGGISYEKPSSSTTTEEEDEEEEEEEVLEKELEDNFLFESKETVLSIKSAEESSAPDARTEEPPMRGLMDNIGKIEAGHQAMKPVKLELQKADAQSFMSATKELIAKIQQLTQHVEKINSDVQQIPGLMSQFEGLKQLYDQFRSTCDHGEKLENDHLESIQMMEQNFVSMAREIKKLQAQLANTADLEKRTSAPDARTVEPPMRGLMDNIGKIEAGHQAVKPVKLELQKADAQSFMSATKELIAKIQQLTQHVEKINSEMQQIPGLMSQFEGLKQLYDQLIQFRTYDHGEKLGSLQMMELNYASMAREVEKFQAVDFERRAGWAREVEKLQAVDFERPAGC